MATKIVKLGDLLNFIKALSNETLEVIMNCVYQGFDPETTWKVLLKKKEELKRNDKEFTSDLILLGIFGSKFGADSSKMGKKTNDMTTEKIGPLIENYEVKESTAGAAPDVISLGRIGCVMGFISTVLLELGVQSPIGELGNLPRSFAHPMGYAMMSNNQRTLYKDDYKLWSISFSRTINRRKTGYEKKTDEQVWNEQKAFVDLTATSGWTLANHDTWVDLGNALRETLQKKYPQLAGADPTLMEKNNP